MNSFFRESNLTAKIILLCRSDLFERIPYPNKNKVKQDSSFSFAWHHESVIPQESALIRIANIRTQLKYPSVHDLFAQFMPSDYEGRSIHRTLMNAARHTPRDFLQLLKSIQHVCSGSMVGPGDIQNGIKRYSIEYFLPEIKDELTGYLPQDHIDMVFTLFSQLRRKHFTLSDVQAVVDRTTSFQGIDIMNAMRTLFECSAIGHMYSVGSSDNYQYSYKYRNRNMAFNASDRITIHRGLWKALNNTDA